MSAFFIELLNFCLIPFQSTGNLIVFVPTACISIVFCFCVVRLLMHGGR